MTKMIPAFLAAGSLLLLAACAVPGMLTPTPTPLPPPAPTATSGISIQGRVWLNAVDGPGLAKVQIYAKGGYGSTDGPARLLATTDPDGYYWNGNAIPLMIVWAELDGYVFEPGSLQYMGTGDSCTDACDFIARPAP
jgi:hypothetical protein